MFLLDILGKIPLVSFAIFSPLIGLAFNILPTKKQKDLNLYKILSFLVSLLPLVFLLCSLVLFNINQKNTFQLVEHFAWFAGAKISYTVGLDGISLLMNLLTATIFPIAILCSMKSVSTKYKEFMSLFLILQTCSLGVFASIDLVLFFMFFEAGLIPMFIIIGVWGGGDRVYSALKFFIYTFLGSVFFLSGIVYIVIQFGTANIIDLKALTPSLSNTAQIILWLSFFISFAIKLPSFPFHTWLPDAHVQAPTAASVVLAGILIKMGGYGFIRLSIPFFPYASEYFAHFMGLLGIISVIYGSIVALNQTDIKKMIAYSSVAHMGYVTIGIFSLNQAGSSAAIFQMISHGIISSALFLSVGVIYERLHTREFKNFGGIATTMPHFAFYLMIFTLGSVGLPGTSGFVGEFLSILSSYSLGLFYTVFTCSGVVLGALYMLKMYKETMYGEIKHSLVFYLKDVSGSEKFYLFFLAFLTVFLGVYPKIITCLI